MWKWLFNATAEHRTSLAPARRGGRGGRGGRGVESETLMELMRRRKRRRKHGWALLHYSCSRLQAVCIIHHNESEPSICGLDCFPFNFLFFSLLKKRETEQQVYHNSDVVRFKSVPSAPTAFEIISYTVRHPRREEERFVCWFSCKSFKSHLFFRFHQMAPQWSYRGSDTGRWFILKSSFSFINSSYLSFITKNRRPPDVAESSRIKPSKWPLS